ncbi:uncharacterized protein LOC117325863 [Pecten maximus]|uniref:uncharacterized protein LOC117325863 n=1 Tax=Pecten maximus TaxID=6579 RepID=UPI001458B9E8|nr:uncharacterized protein LOC117325863 [Pecten maximus]
MAVSYTKLTKKSNAKHSRWKKKSVKNHAALVQNESKYDSLSLQDETDALTSLSQNDVYSNLNTCDDSITYTESLEVDVIYSAPPLQDLYRYHVFFSHSPEDQSWVFDIVTRLQSEPYNYRCYYSGGNSNGPQPKFLPNELCAAMLSERVVVVLTRHYVKSTWFEFQDVLQNLTQCSLYRQRMLTVLLRECSIPEPLQNLGFLDARESDFFRCLVRHLKSEGLPRSSESFSSEMSCILYSPTNIENGQLLATVQIDVVGRWKAQLVCRDDDDVPTPLCCHGVSMSYGEFINILQTLTGPINEDKTFSFLFSLRPILILLVAVGMWLATFIFVLIFLRDESKQSALGVRLPVFSLPMLFVLYGYGIRWKRQRRKDKIVKSMLLNCVTLNENLYESERPVLLTVTAASKGVFSIHFLYFCMFDCVGDVDLLLNTYMEEDAEKFATLIELYTKNQDYVIQGTMAERMCVMLSAPYLHRMLQRQLPKSSQQRHTNHTFCLCQFIEIFIEDFFGCITKKKLVKELRLVLHKHLNFLVKKETLREYQEKLAINEDFSFVST